MPYLCVYNIYLYIILDLKNTNIIINNKHLCLGTILNDFHLITQSSQQLYEGDTVVILILSKRKLKHREIK